MPARKLASSRYLAPLAILCLSISLSGCGGSGGSGTSAESSDDRLDIREPDVPIMPPLYALTLSRADDTSLSLTVDAVWRSITGAVRPLSSMTGDYLVLAYDGDTIVDAVPVGFTVATPHDFDGAGAGETLQLDEVQVQIDASTPLTRIDVIDQTASVLASVDTLPAVDTTPDRRSVGSALFSNYPWIDVLSAGDTSPVHDVGAPNGVMSLSDEELELIESLLDRMPPRLVSAIDTLAFSDIGSAGHAWGGHVIIDTDTLDNPERGRLYWTLVHEAGHAYHNASGYVGGRDFGSWSVQWPPAALAAIRETHRKLGIDRDVLALWADLHASAVDANLAEDYRGERAPPVASPYYSGFVSGYGSSALQEDFADAVALANFLVVKELSPMLSAVTCTHFQVKGAARSPISEFDALAYAKLRLVEAMELAEPASIDDCLGDAAPTYDEGIFLGEALHFDRAFNAGYTGADRAQFNITAQDAEGRGLAMELATEGTHPIGVYPLDVTWWGAWEGNNSLVLASPTATEARTGWSGTVVISYASSGDRVDGFVLDLRLANAFGPVSQFDFVPFRIPLN